MSKEGEEETAQERVVDAEEAEIPSFLPLVFSCASCRTIVGDSCSLVDTNEQLQTVTLSGASNVTRLKERLTSDSPADEGSSYNELQCAGCQAVLGKFYLTTPRALDVIREQFSFLVDKLQSYEIGRVSQGVAGPVKIVHPDSDAPSSSSSSAENIAAAMNEELSKVHHIVLSLAHRVGELEQGRVGLAAVEDTQQALVTSTPFTPQNLPSYVLPMAAKRPSEDSSSVIKRPRPISM